MLDAEEFMASLDGSRTAPAAEHGRHGVIRDLLDAGWGLRAATEVPLDERRAEYALPPVAPELAP